MIIFKLNLGMSVCIIIKAISLPLTVQLGLILEYILYMKIVIPALSMGLGGN